jgi:hypothetical protein
MTKKSRKIIIASAILVSVAVAVPLTISYQRHHPNFAKMTPRQIREYFDSNAFRDANEDARRQVFEQMGEAMQARTEAQVKGYFALAEGEDRTAYLDKIIDEMQARRAEFLSSRDPNRDPNMPFDPNRFADPNRRPRFAQRGQMVPGQRPRIDPERNRARSSRMSADMRVKSAQFRRDLFNRMQQRGIQMPMGRPGGPGGPGGGGGFGPGRGFGGPPG